MENKIQKAFSIYNGGKGLDHWSYSSTSTPFAKNLIGYSFPQEVRRTFAFRYKANFGNLVNNVVQRMIADVIYKSKTITRYLQNGIEATKIVLKRIRNYK